MKTTELRQGNKILWGKQVETVVAILADDFIQCDPLSADRTIDEFEPIPITPEILEKCGFEKSGKFYEKNQILLLSVGDVYYYYYNCINEVRTMLKYLHQLQNLYYALTGDELPITF